MTSTSSSIASTSDSSSATSSASKTIPSVTYSQVSNQQLTNITGNTLRAQVDLATLSYRSSTYATLDAALQTLIGQLPTYQDQTQVAGLSASSNSTAIGVTMGSQGVAGSYTVNVTQLARPQINQSTSKTTTAVAGAWGDGRLSIKAGAAAAVNVTVSTSMTVQQLSDAINAANAGVTASVGGTTGAFYVTVTGNKTGTSNAVTFTETGSNTGIGSNVTQAAGNTNFTVNGTSYSSQTNTSPNGVPGATLSFSALTSNAVVTIAANATSVASSLTNFVGAYNTALTAVDTALQNGIQDNDPLLLVIRKQLSRIAAYPSSGASGTFRSLADVGITRNSDDTLTVNANILNSAAATNAASVAGLLTGTALGTTGLAADLAKVTAAFAEPGIGTLNRVQTSLSRTQLRLSRGLESAQSTVDRISNVIGEQYTSLEVALSRYAFQSLLVSSLTSNAGITAAAVSNTLLG